MDMYTGESLIVGDAFFVGGFIIYENWIYYLDGTYLGILMPLKRMNLDSWDIQIIDYTGDTVQISEDFHAPIGTGIRRFIINDGWIYFIGQTFENRHSAEGIYRMRTDGSNRELFHTANAFVDHINIIDDWLYYRHYSNHIAYTSRIRLDGTGHQNINDLIANP